MTDLGQNRRDGIRVTTFAGPGARAEFRTVPWPDIPRKGALIRIHACGVCGTDLHILKGHWPTPLPWPFTLGHELAGEIVEIGPELTTDHMGLPIAVGSKLALPPLMPCGTCDWCMRYPDRTNKCPDPVYYGRTLGFERPPHLWGGWSEYVFVDLEALPGTKIYKIPDDMSYLLASLTEPLTSCIRGFARAAEANAFKWGDTVVIQGSGPIGILAIAAAREMGAGRVIVIGAPDAPRLALARAFGADATVDIEVHQSAEARIKAVRDIVGGYGADVVMDCAGHPTAGPEGIEFLRDGGCYVEMGQATDSGSIETNWHRFVAKDITLLGSFAYAANDIALGIQMLDIARDRYPWREMQTLYPFTPDGVGEAIADAIAMRTVKSTIIPHEEPAPK